MLKSRIDHRLVKLIIALWFLACLLPGFACESDPDPDDPSDCGDMCRKVQECAWGKGFDSNFEDLPQCIGRCKDIDKDETLACMLACDVEQECEFYETCLLEC